ncbi:hypothetical protein CONPUDRAFT_66805 [Coniophora puteana RWD-64-598 SS2]|uniref:Uncharacterized protein n=1 Tax=Coniophora puteana (strain RWD-64-598) TaxID=741705 RepID=A0A5M3M6Q8_CONPW|nr:uncharacterized protein CONPUDRAFT_66805 [Coniophora puteana RWD-64-598 SS2]EIW75018.1 hypothetical protein CONPUDRAFT_66805 [Coniophora puteana RWD-64-598 SS2]
MLLGGLRDSNGGNVSLADVNSPDVTAMDYNTCVTVCGTENEAFVWSDFVQRVLEWLLPYLSLCSQLPFGAKYNTDNLMSIVLAAGSPALAGYTLFMTMLNTRWINKSFEAVKSFPNTAEAARVLSSLQQVPVHVSDAECMLSSLVVLPENDDWWFEFAESVIFLTLNYMKTWSISAAVSITWVILAWIFTATLFTLTSRSSFVNQSVGTMFLWLIPVVVGWQQLSPKCDYDRLSRAFDRSDAKAYVATHEGGKKAGLFTEERAISIAPVVSEDAVSPDVFATPPIFNYSRTFAWSRSAEEVLRAFQYASSNAAVHKPVNPERTWEVLDDDDIHPDNRRGPPIEVERYCGRLDSRQSPWASGVLTRVALASIAGLVLQWGTTGPAIIMLLYTPTVGLACRSLSLLTYGLLSTMIWMMMLASSVAAHYAISHHQDDYDPLFNHVHHIWKRAADVFRLIGQVLAVLNSIIFFSIPVLEFANLFDNCYYDSSVLGLGRAGAYNVVTLLNSDEEVTKRVYALCMAAAALCAVAFVAVFNINTDWDFQPSNRSGRTLVDLVCSRTSPSSFAYIVTSEQSLNLFLVFA